ncbi:hypothetical protein FHS82_000735 [Pseudochelatococcus lubricantis]|uniref:Uncharacterized protein n=1 Tax=Pseudochelatococcus lubricantis TaxID=1538102 RepID=A0ABX0UVY3_9HYPH|nr:hypothetical protein [Pseudochelatococcus lubricantis]NIJ56922.1 hypothetical protein [Pseudochelatococcus lubricantis]
MRIATGTSSSQFSRGAFAIVAAALILGIAMTANTVAASLRHPVSVQGGSSLRADHGSHPHIASLPAVVVPAASR